MITGYDITNAMRRVYGFDMGTLDNLRPTKDKPESSPPAPRRFVRLFAVFLQGVL